MQTQPLTPYGARPSPRQLAWHDLEFYGFLHFTVNTFTNREWGHGDESPAIFNPTDFSAEQIVETAALGGMRGLILTAKHHDGFCLWPSAYTEHSVKNSPWRGGKGDVVAEIAAACQQRGLKFGVYLSPWDRNHPEYARPGYIQYYRAQLRELLTHYGALFEVWFDGANGGDGYYGGQREKRQIDARTYYEWEATFAMIRELQPEACIFGGAPGTDIRWVGNEHGIAGDPCWHTLHPHQNEVEGASRDTLNSGQRDGEIWYPAECDVSIRPGWFYHRREDRLVRTPANLLDLYFQSVGRGASLLLNLPPTPQGRIHARDRAALIAFRELREKLFAANLAQGAEISASSTRIGGTGSSLGTGSSGGYTPAHLLDGQPDTFWSPEEFDTQPELGLRFPAPVTFNVINLREYLPLGQRVDGFSVEAWNGSAWQRIASGSAIGHRRLVRLEEEVSASALRLRFQPTPARPAIRELSLHLAPPVTPASPVDWFYRKVFTKIH